VAEETPASEAHQPPPGVSVVRAWHGPDGPVEYTATAGWTVLRKDEKPVAEVFSVAYVVDEPDRPVSFVFNGGPGASSAFLHMGVAGPRRVVMNSDGSLPPAPAVVADNESSWLAFTDLVFIDPVGTGFSRAVPEESSGDDKKPQPDTKEFFAVKRDLESLAEFMDRWMSDNGRWGSPVFIAGESYGGYRVGRLARLLQETTGIGLNGAVLISPALEVTALTPSDYDMATWIDTLPVQAVAAAHHGRSRVFTPETPLEEVAAEAEAFATGDYARFLVQGAAMDRSERLGVMQHQADLLGLSAVLVERAEGRISMQVFSRELLRDERSIVGLYDASVTGPDPFPDRATYAGPDPTLAGDNAAFTTAVNQVLRQELGVETTRDYRVLSYDVFNSWKDDVATHAFVPSEGATDDLRYAMALNPHMLAFIAHGRHDLVTPYFASDRLRNLMRLDPVSGGRLRVQHFPGGHMFYGREASRRAFSGAMATFVADAVAGQAAGAK
jgi:carboxypeptidase C (cathepsin A)